MRLLPPFLLIPLVLFPLLSSSSRANVTPFGFMHSHNDYQKKRPLLDALAHGFDSIEADIWLVNRQILISHLGIQFVGNLKEMYLDPLQKLVDQKGSIHGDGKPFALWLDIKDGNPDLVEELYTLLEKYSMLTTFSDTQVTQRPVTIILTGHEQSKIDFVEKHPLRKACRDSNNFKIYDPVSDNRWLWYSLKWGDLFRWGGYSKVREIEKEKLKSLVIYIHKKGRKVRFWDTPETEDFWTLALAAKVDLISTDHPDKMAIYSKGFTAH